MPPHQVYRWMGPALLLIARDSVPLYLDMQEMSLFVGLVKYILCSKKSEA